MKMLFCGKCFSMHSFKVNHPDDTEHPWTSCDCKQMAARWSDPQKGTVQVLALVPERTFIIGMSNTFLTEVVMGDRFTDVGWRKLHEEVTKSPGHVFDASNRNCWAAVMRVGETSDISWHPGQEQIRNGATIAEVLFQPVRIKVNTMDAIWKHPTISYKDIVELAGKDSTKGTIYTISCYVRGKEGFCVSPGQTVQAEAGMIINCMYTGNA